MKKSILIAVAFISACVIGIQAQNGIQARNLMANLKERAPEYKLDSFHYIDSVNFQDKDGISLLMFASELGYTGLCKILIEQGADLDNQSKNGLTALILASQNGYFEIMKLLLEKGSDPDLPESVFKTTALMQASQNGHTDVVSCLLNNNADPELRIIEGKTALDYAINNDIKRLLESYGQNE